MIFILPSEELQSFLNFVARSQDEYQSAYQSVNKEDRRLQDLLHMIELSQGAKERNSAAKRLKESRNERRRNKDITLMNEEIVKFFEDPQNKKALNQLTQLLGRQRKQEKMLTGEHTYYPRVND